MSVFTVKILNNLPHVISEGPSDSFDFEIETGDFTPTQRFTSEALDIGASIGTTAFINSNPGVNQLFGSLPTTFVAGEWCAIRLNTGQWWWSICTNADNGSGVGTIKDPVPSLASSGSQIITQADLNGATDLDLLEDFKFSKYQEIIGNTNRLKTAELKYSDTYFVADDELKGELGTYLDSGREATEFNVLDSEGRDYTFINANDLANLTYEVAGYVANIHSGQSTLIQQLWEALNNQTAVDAIIDNRTPTQPSLTGQYKPFVKYFNEQAQLIRVIPTTDEEDIGIDMRNVADTLTGLRVVYQEDLDRSLIASNATDLLVEAVNNYTVKTGFTTGSDRILFDAGDGDGVTIQMDGSGTTPGISIQSSAVGDINVGGRDLFFVGQSSTQIAAPTIQLEQGENTSALSITSETPDNKALNIKSNTNSADSDIFVLTSDPEGVVTGFGGDVAVKQDSGNADIWLKENDIGNTGWRSLVNKTDILFGASAVQAGTATRYLHPGNSESIAPTSTRVRPAGRSGVIRNMWVSHGVPAGNGNAIIYTLLINGVASALSVSLSSTSALDLSGSTEVSVNSSDLLSIEVTKAAGVATSPSNITVIMEYL